MTIAIARKALLWCAMINYGVLLVWFLVFLLGHEWMYGWHSRWFQLSREQFYALHYGALTVSCRSWSGRSAGGCTSRSAGMTSSPMSRIERMSFSCSRPPNIIQLLTWVTPTLAARLNFSMTVAGLPKKRRSR